jgi:hypothetical protein
MAVSCLPSSVDLAFANQQRLSDFDGSKRIPSDCGIDANRLQVRQFGYLPHGQKIT